LTGKAKKIRGYDAQEFERQYNPRLWTTDSETWVKRNEELSKELRARVRSATGIAWGPRPTNTLDLFFPEARSPEGSD